MCPKTEEFLAGTGLWDEDVKKYLESELPTMEVRLFEEVAQELPSLAQFLNLCQGGDRAFRKALENAFLIIQKRGFEILEQRFYRMLTVGQDEEDFWRVWKWIKLSIDELTDVQVTSEGQESIKALQDTLRGKMSNLEKRFDTFYNNKSHS